MTSAWLFGVAAWSRPGVAAIGLALQDEHGQCPPLLLWRLWTVHEARAVEAASLHQAVGLARAWTSDVVAPLRDLRRRLTDPFQPVDLAGRGALRDRLAADELAAEKVLIDALEQLAPARGDSPVAALDALIDLTRGWGADAPAALLERLIAGASPGDA